MIPSRRIGGIAKELPSVEKIVIVPYVTERPDLSPVPQAVLYRDFLAKEDGLNIDFEQLPFDHPVYIMYLIRHDRAAQVHGARGRGDTFTALQRTRFALRHDERR